MVTHLNLLPQLTQVEMIPPVIQPVPLGIKRPRWSVMIPTYNCARFLRETLESVLSQDIDPEEMQIEVIDDCSTSDDPDAVVREFGQGRVSFYRKPANAGAIANFNTCIERSTGHCVHILHGDDFVKPGFYRRMEEEAQGYGQSISLFICRTLEVDESGNLEYLSMRIKGLEQDASLSNEELTANKIRTPACVVRRSFYEEHGGFLPSLPHCADWEMWLRAILQGKARFINEPLATYRFFDNNDSSRLAKTGENALDCCRLVQILKNKVEESVIDGILANSAALARLQADRFLAAGDLSAAQANLAVANLLSGDVPKRPNRPSIRNLLNRCQARLVRPSKADFVN